MFKKECFINTAIADQVILEEGHEVEYQQSLTKMKLFGKSSDIFSKLDGYKLFESVEDFIQKNPQYYFEDGKYFIYSSIKYFLPNGSQIMYFKTYDDALEEFQKRCPYLIKVENIL